MISALWLIPACIGFGFVGFMLAVLCMACHTHEE